MEYRVIERELNGDGIKAYINSADGRDEPIDNATEIVAQVLGNAADCLNDARIVIQSRPGREWKDYVTYHLKIERHG